MISSSASAWQPPRGQARLGPEISPYKRQDRMRVWRIRHLGERNEITRVLGVSRAGLRSARFVAFVAFVAVKLRACIRICYRHKDRQDHFFEILGVSGAITPETPSIYSILIAYIGKFPATIADRG
jgi:hypothetical protein